MKEGHISETTKKWDNNLTYKQKKFQAFKKMFFIMEHYKHTQEESTAQ